MFTKTLNGILFTDLIWNKFPLIHRTWKKILIDWNYLHFSSLIRLSFVCSRSQLSVSQNRMFWQILTIFFVFSRKMFNFFLNYDYLPCYLLSFYQNDALFQKNKNKIVNRFLLAESKTPFRRVFFTSIYDCVNILCWTLKIGIHVGKFLESRYTFSSFRVWIDTSVMVSLQYTM